ncbi:MAG: B12-binding domain-containing radical SAM protein [Alphaproteobacteria bacterium]|nr:B12-binding domain-containing radical SAM protein [Alphaproteobacteria bacterium]
MRCALIIPAWTPEEIFPSGTAGSQINYWQPLGTLYVGACLLKAGHEVTFLDGSFLTHEAILQRIRELKPEFAGIYSTTFGWAAALRTAEDVKALDSGIWTCVGGPYPTAAPDSCLADGCGAIDAVVAGEGEETVVEILDRLASGRDLAGVAGVIAWQDGRIVRNPPRPLIADLDALPFPARELLGDRSRYIPAPATYRRKPVAIVTTSRGCDRRCLFCFQMDRERKSGVRGVRYRSIDNVLEEIESCLRDGYREIKFIDDSLAADRDRAMRLATEIQRRRLDFTWFASVCANQADATLFRAMKDAGCWAVLIGGESGIQKNLNTIRKGATLDQIRKAVAAAKAAGLRVTVPFIFGIPGETYYDALKTIDFAVSLDPDLANFHAVTPFPGTPLYDSAAEYGTISSDLRDFTFQGAAFVPHSMTREEILNARQLAFRKFYSRPSFLLRRLVAIRSIEDCRTAITGLRSLFWLWMGRMLFRRKRPAPRQHPAEPRPTRGTP